LGRPSVCTVIIRKFTEPPSYVSLPVPSELTVRLSAGYLAWLQNHGVSVPGT
jgi:hypothetical protein